MMHRVAPAMHPAGITRSAGFAQGGKVRGEVNAFRFAAGRDDTGAPQTTAAIPRITIREQGVAAFPSRAADPETRRFSCRLDSVVFSCRKLSDESPARARERDPGIPRHPTDAESVRSELASKRRECVSLYDPARSRGIPDSQFIAIEALEIASGGGARSTVRPARYLFDNIFCDVK